jgi:hypothetical protein
MFDIFQSSIHSRRVMSTHATFEAAEAALLAMEPVHYERDADNPGCADAYLKTAVVVCIEPSR